MALPNLILTHEMEDALHTFPRMDPHTHVDAAHAGARGRDDILLDHMAVSDLYAAGCPTGERVPDNRDAAEALPYESGSRLNQRTIGHLAEIVARYPGLRFQCFLASRHANQSLCTLARELPNLSLAGYWWHNFFPGAIRQVIEERLDMLPVNRQIGFFSDAYCVEWSYAKKKLVGNMMAEVLAAKIEIGQYSVVDAVSVARSIFYDSSVELRGMTPRESLTLKGVQT